MRCVNLQGTENIINVAIDYNYRYGDSFIFF